MCSSFPVSDIAGSPFPAMKRTREKPYSWHPRVKRPRWPDPGNEAAWTPEDIRSATSVNTLMLDGLNHEHLSPPPFIKCSLAIQALNLRSAYYGYFDLNWYGDFDDFEFSRAEFWTFEMLKVHFVEIAMEPMI